MCPLPPPPRLSRTALSIAVQEFAIVPLHAAPLDAVAEMDALYDVYLDVRQKWDLEVSPRPGPWAHVLYAQAKRLLSPVGHHAHGRLQRRLQLCDPLPVGLHPPAHEPSFPVADS